MTPSTDLLAFRRTLAAGMVTRFALVSAALVGTAMYMFSSGNERLVGIGAGLFAVSSVAYFYLSWKSLTVSRDAMPAHEHLARGNLPEAEEILTAALRRFSLFPAQRSVELLQLSQLRLSQGRFAESADLAAAVLPLRTPGGVGVAARLLLLEAVTELGDLTRAHKAILDLAGTSLPSADAARLMLCRTRYESAISAFDHVLYALPEKLKLAETLGAVRYGRWCLEVARAARATGRTALMNHMIERAKALMEPGELSRAVPDLADAIDSAGAETVRSAP